MKKRYPNLNLILKNKDDQTIKSNSDASNLKDCISRHKKLLFLDFFKDNVRLSKIKVT
jgi:hypothetical protein